MTMYFIQILESVQFLKRLSVYAFDLAIQLRCQQLLLTSVYYELPIVTTIAP